MTAPSIPARDKAIFSLTEALAKFSILIECVYPPLFTVCIDRILNRAKRPDGEHEESFILHNAHWYAGLIHQALSNDFVNIDAEVEFQDIAHELELLIAEPTTSH